MKTPLLLLPAFFALFCAVLADYEELNTVVQYTDDNFHDELPKKHHFIMFYAPWCAHCKNVAPTWDQLAEMLNEPDSTIKIAKVDCTSDSKICVEQDITGYPTLKFFKMGESEGVKFRGTRDLPTLTNFINEQLSGSEDSSASDASIIRTSTKGLKELTEDSFEKETASGKAFVKFYAPWCGHCQKLAPVWEDLAKTMEFNEEITVAKIDCTQHRSVCNSFEVKGYPTLLWLENGKKIEKYQGDRSLEDLKQYVNKMAGSSVESVKEESVESGPNPVEDLNGDNFVDGVKTGVTFVKFFAPWCGHCKRLAPTWEELGRKYSKNDGVTIAKVDCTLDENKDLCNEQEIEGFPSLFLYKEGTKISEYSGSRSLEDLSNFVNSHDTAHSAHEEL